MTFDDAIERLRQLARDNGGVLTAAAVERDHELAASTSLAAAAARALAGSTNVFGTPRASTDGWFPFEQLAFSLEA